MSEENASVIPTEEEVKANVVDLYIGQGKVIKTEPRGQFVHYELEDGRSGLAHFEQYNSMTKEQPYNEEYAIVYKWAPVSAKILKLLLEVDMPMSDMNFVTKQVQQSIIDNYEKAVAKTFGRQLTDHIRLSQIDSVLKTTTELIKE